MAEWRPIKTAPRNGTPILAINSQLLHPPVVVRWQHKPWIGRARHWCDAATPDGSALYYNAHYFDFWQMPPEPPK